MSYINLKANHKIHVGAEAGGSDPAHGKDIGGKQALGGTPDAKAPASRKRRPTPATPKTGSDKKPKRAAAAGQQSMDAFLVKNTK